MKVVSSMIVGLCLLTVVAKAQDTAPSPAPAAGGTALDPKAVGAITSYGIGRNFGRELKSKGIEPTLDSLVQGIRDALESTPAKYSDDQLRAAFEVLDRQIQAKQAQQGEKNKQEGEEFLAKNKTKQGVVTQPSGLQYEVLKAGNGPSPKTGDTVKVHYEGKLLDGSVFDSSIKRGQPTQFGVNQVIAGWTEALLLMKVGDKWRLYIPAKLAYGEQGMEGAIPPNSLLTFEVELLDVQPAGGK